MTMAAARVKFSGRFFQFVWKMTIMTIMVKLAKGQIMSTTTWTVAEAKAKFSEVIDRARGSGPQTITRHGRDAVVVVSIEEWDRRTRRTGNLAEFFAGSPLRDSGLEIERATDLPREIDL